MWPCWIFVIKLLYLTFCIKHCMASRDKDASAGQELRWSVYSYVPLRDAASESKRDRNYSEICEKQTAAFEPRKSERNTQEVSFPSADGRIRWECGGKIKWAGRDLSQVFWSKDCQRNGMWCYLMLERACRHTCQEEQIKGEIEQNVNRAVALWSGAKLYIEQNNEPLWSVRCLKLTFEIGKKLLKIRS